MGEKVPQLLDWLGFNLNPDFGRSRVLGKLLGIAIIVVILALGSLVLTETFAALLGLGLEEGTTQHEAIRNTGLALAAMVGVPFLVWRSVVAQKQVDVTEQGHITDRINKAVEGLGAEKKVDQIGRPVTVYFGEQDVYDDLHKSKQDFVLPPRSVAKREEWVENTSDGRDGDGFWSREVTTWTDEETRIEWEDNSLSLASDEHLASKGDWQVFSRSEPNLEVRFGAILSLERIAQDSARDHIQIMEILCAYIRENIGNRPIRALPEDRTPEGWRAWGEAERTAPRLDIDMALKVIERRGAGRRAAEAAQEPAFRLGLERLAGTGLDLQGRALEKADLMGAELQGADLEGAELQGANLRDAKLQGANLRDAKLQGAYLWGAELQGANFGDAELQGANFGDAELQGAYLGEAELQGANLLGAKLQGANFEFAKLQGTYLGEAEFDTATELSSAALRGALLSSVDLDDPPRIGWHIDPAHVFFDGSIILPGGITSDMPEWPYEDRRDVLEYDDLLLAWRAWQREHHPDTLPDHLR